jgi:hypothetical protein
MTYLLTQAQMDALDRVCANAEQNPLKRLAVFSVTIFELFPIGLHRFLSRHARACRGHPRLS